MDEILNEFCVRYLILTGMGYSPAQAIEKIKVEGVSLGYLPKEERVLITSEGDGWEFSYLLTYCKYVEILRDQKLQIEYCVKHKIY